MERLQNINISGTGKINGGKFENINISGFGKILGDVEANLIEVSGMATVNGRAKMQRFVVQGNGTVEGELEGSELDITGNFKIKGSTKVNQIRNEGRARFKGSVKADKVACFGYISADQDLEAENFNCEGSFSIQGLLNANKISVEINGFCYAKEIGCEEIRVRCQSHWNFFHKLMTPFLGPNHAPDKLTTDLLEGTLIQISDTHAKVVRGQDIRIGPGCKIGEVEYSGKLEIDPQAIVGKQTKITIA